MVSQPYLFKCIIFPIAVDFCDNITKNWNLTVRFPYAIVGAIIDRPAAHCHHFALLPANSQHFTAQALTERPYQFTMDVLFKFQFVDGLCGICFDILFPL